MLLKGTELAGFIKERQARAVNSLQHLKTTPHLAIVSSNKELVSSKYIEIKQKYGSDIGLKVSLYAPTAVKLVETLKQLNQDPAIHGIIVQLPISGIDVYLALNTIKPEKDVDGLGKNSLFDPPTPTAILWFLSNYGVEMEGKSVVLVGHGRLVGAPLAQMLRNSGVEPIICDEDTKDLKAPVRNGDIVITATGQPGLITADMVKPGAVVIDAGTADVNGSLAGDVDSRQYERNDIKVSPVPGGVGPLTVCALFENLLTAFKNQTN